jgi:hypothetical protein
VPFIIQRDKDKGRLLYVDRFGVGFIHKGDEVIWLWPWMRSHQRRAWLSIGFEAEFMTLRDLDQEWEGYFEAQRRSYPEVDAGEG